MTRVGVKPSSHINSEQPMTHLSIIASGPCFKKGFIQWEAHTVYVPPRRNIVESVDNQVKLLDEFSPESLFFHIPAWFIPIFIVISNAVGISKTWVWYLPMVSNYVDVRVESERRLSSHLHGDQTKFWFEQFAHHSKPGRTYFRLWSANMFGSKQELSV